MHPSFETSPVWDRAWDAFQAAFRRLAIDPDDSRAAVCFLADLQGQHYFRDLSRKANGTLSDKAAWMGDWSAAPTLEDHSILLERPDGANLFVIGGCQRVSSERIEILIFGEDPRLPDGLPLKELLSHLFEANAWVILPWGVGKWLGRRGSIVRSHLESRNPWLLAGDNGNRPSFWSFPKKGFLTGTKNPPILRGSDPLRIAGDFQRIGTFGSYFRGAWDPEKPFRSLDSILRDYPEWISSYGKPMAPLSFFSHQVKLKLS